MKEIEVTKQKNKFPEKKGREEISIDFDGVIMDLFMGRTWVFSETATSPVGHTALRDIRDRISSLVAHIFRKSTAAMQPSLQSMSRRFELYLLTSRRSVTRGITLKWLNQRHVLKLFKSCYFREGNISPVEHKMRIIRSMGFDYHIDDSLKVIDMMSREFPKVRFIHFCTDGQTLSRQNVITVGSWKEITELFSL